MTESDAGMLACAGQARTVFVTHRALMVIKVRMTLTGCEKVHTGEQNILLYQKPASMSAGKLELAWK